MSLMNSTMSLPALTRERKRRNPAAGRVESIVNRVAEEEEQAVERV